MDFTLKTYRQLLESLQNAGFSFITFAEYLENEEFKMKNEELWIEKLKTKSEKLKQAEHPTRNNEQQTRNNEQQTRNKEQQTKNKEQKIIILRHDVDLLPQNSLTFARIQHEMGIRGSYYFRAVPESWDEAIIKEIHRLGHEVGYHYEDMDLMKNEKPGSEKQKTKSEKLEQTENPTRNKEQETRNKEQRTRNKEQRTRNNEQGTKNNEPLIDAAISSFRHNLEKLRQLVPVKTICMHGSPRSKYDNRDLWKKYDYRDFGIIGEPYFDMDFDEVFYLTDTGRRWDGWKVSVRDKVPQQERWVEEGLVFRSTGEIVERVGGLGDLGSWGKGEKESGGLGDEGTRGKGVFPERVMFTFHPQRWTDNVFLWTKELILQNLKNQVKRLLVK